MERKDQDCGINIYVMMFRINAHSNELSINIYVMMFRINARSNELSKVQKRVRLQIHYLIVLFKLLSAFLTVRIDKECSKYTCRDVKP